MTVQQSFDAFMDSRRLAGLSEKTLSDYMLFVLPFVVSVNADRAFNDLSQEDVSSYISSVLKRPVSKSTRATYIRHLKVYLKWAEDRFGAGYRSALVRVPKSPKREVRINSKREISYVLVGR